MAENRKNAAIKGWQTRHARQRMLKEAQEYADARQRMHADARQRSNWAQAQNSNAAQDYANASRGQNNYVSRDEARQIYPVNEKPEVPISENFLKARKDYGRDARDALAKQIYQQNEEPEARKDRLAKLKAWWSWFYHGE